MEIAPDQRLDLDSPHDQTLVVTAGIVYAVAGDHDFVLVPGDSLALAAGSHARAWNAGDEPAEVEVQVKRLRLLRAA